MGGLAARRSGASSTISSGAELASGSDVILSGRVIEVAAGWDADTIYTYVTIAVDEVVKGWVPERRVTLKQLGGRVDDLALIVDDQASFTRGEETYAGSAGRLARGGWSFDDRTLLHSSDQSNRRARDQELFCSVRKTS